MVRNAYLFFCIYYNMSYLLDFFEHSRTKRSLLVYQSTLLGLGCHWLEYSFCTPLSYETLILVIYIKSVVLFFKIHDVGFRCTFGWLPFAPALGAYFR